MTENLKKNAWSINNDQDGKDERILSIRVG